MCDMGLRKDRCWMCLEGRCCHMVIAINCNDFCASCSFCHSSCILSLHTLFSLLSSQILSHPHLSCAVSSHILSPAIYVILSIYISCQQFPCPFSNTIFNYFCFVSLLSTDAPILVYIHGGYWQELSRDQSAYCVVPQYQSGIRVIVVGYDLAPRGHFHYPSSCSSSCSAFKTKRMR